MKKNYHSDKRPKWVGMTLFTVFCCLFANMAMAQETFSWIGSSSNNSATAGNWTKTGTAGRDTSPGQTSGQQLDFNDHSRVTNCYLYNKFKLNVTKKIDL